MGDLGVCGEDDVLHVVRDGLVEMLHTLMSTGGEKGKPLRHHVQQHV
jgi:hypothetical protein